MKKISRTTIVICLLISILASSTLPAVAFRASDQLNQYSVSLSNVKRGTMRVTFTVLGMGVMDTIGAQQIIIEQEVATNTWQECYRYSGIYGYNRVMYDSTVDFSVISGVKYRARLTAYAKDSKGSDTGTVTSGSLRAMA